MRKLFQEDIDVRPEDLVAGLLEACEIKAPPTHDQLVFDFLNLKREPLPTELVTTLSSTFGIAKIQAMLDLSEQIVLLHPHLEDNRERYAWASLHEVGHYVLPDHRELLFKCSWQDLSLSAKKRLETEANRFAADLIFQNDFFTEEASDEPLSIKVPIALRDRYRASFEATIRRYVEKNPRPCALVVYRPKKTDDDDPEPSLEVQYSVRSHSWQHFAYILPHQLSSPASPEHRVFYQKSRGTAIIETDFITGSDNQTARVFPSELFSNTYRVFQLVHPPE